MLTQRRSYASSHPQPEFWHEVEIDGTVVVRGQECTLERGIGYPAGRYKFQYAEVCTNGEVMLMFYGPSRRKKQRYREVWRNAAAVRRIHR